MKIRIIPWLIVDDKKIIVKEFLKGCENKNFSLMLFIIREGDERKILQN